jgi:hypothetical protein
MFFFVHPNFLPVTRAPQKSLVIMVACGDREVFCNFCAFCLAEGKAKGTEIAEEKHAEALPLHECDFEKTELLVTTSLACQNHEVLSARGPSLPLQDKGDEPFCVPHVLLIPLAQLGL